MAFDRTAGGASKASGSLSGKLAAFRGNKCGKIGFDAEDRRKQQSERKGSRCLPLSPGTGLRGKQPVSF